MEQSDFQKKLKRETVREALKQKEEAARTLADFEKIVDEWNKLDSNRERRERRYEICRRDELLEQGMSGETVIPPPIAHEWWQQISCGDFLDIIFDCPHEIAELIPNRQLFGLINSLNENQKEVLYYCVIRQWSPQRLAKLRRQSDRNIRKVYDTLIDRVRKKLYEQLASKFENNLPLTQAQREFVELYEEQYGDIKKHKKKTVVDTDNE